VLSLPDQVRACLFDLDGVLTQTAKVHEAAWKEMFDAYLQSRSTRTGEPFVPFQEHDYDLYVDGKPRADGTRDFLASRGIHLPEGSDDDPPGTETIRGLGTWKNNIVLRRIREDGVEPYEGSVRFLERAKEAGLRRVVVSSSANARDVLVAAGMDHLVEGVIDGIVAAQEHLHGKPAPDAYLAGARLAGVGPDQASVFEDALAGVEAGRAGHFAWVVGVDRVGQADALKAHGASVVVSDLADLLDHA
jgi:HAD superfamily hydrolase (TIGR01509 family)